MSSDLPTPGKARPNAAAGRPRQARRPPAGTLPAPVASDSAGTPPPAVHLTPEEQMKLFEKELKENDWGHQPC